MIPTPTYPIGGELTVMPAGERPSLTYGIDFAAGTISGRVDGAAAVRQAIYKLLQTERFTFLVYSWDYGAELGAVRGLDREMADSELRRVITEALLADSRITAVGEITVTRAGSRAAAVTVSVFTLFGEVEMEVTADV